MSKAALIMTLAVALLASEDVLGRVRSAMDAVSGYRPPPQ